MPTPVIWLGASMSSTDIDPDQIFRTDMCPYQISVTYIGTRSIILSGRHSSFPQLLNEYQPTSILSNRYQGSPIFARDQPPLLTDTKPPLAPPRLFQHMPRPLQLSATNTVAPWNIFNQSRGIQTGFAAPPGPSKTFTTGLLRCAHWKNWPFNQSKDCCACFLWPCSLHTLFR